MKNDIITITKPDDMHIHLRDGAYLQTTVPDAAKRFARAIVMPNLKPPITRVNQALAYRERILTHVPKGLAFEPLMTLYLTDNSSASEIQRAKNSGIVYACKLYPAGSTTNSDSGVTAIENIYPILEVMQKIKLPLLIHGEVADPQVDIFDREKMFIDTHLNRLIDLFPELPIVLEHITTKHAVDFMLQTNAKIAATITAHHLLINRNDLLAGGIRPHHYCLPICKRSQDQKALISAATSGDKRFFLGTDSAPHPKGDKESSCGCAGIYTAHAALELYAEVFEKVDASKESFEAFCSFNGADFYGLPYNEASISLHKQSWIVPDFIPYGGTELIPFRTKAIINWTIA